MRNCDSCNTELKPVFENTLRRADDYPQYEDALVVELGGGYGMLIDTGTEIGVEIPLFVLCRNCGVNLIAQNEFMVTPETEFLIREDFGELR